MSGISDYVGSKLLFENDRVRVWDLILAPGESTGRHRHKEDYLYIVDADGVKGESRPMVDGEVRWRDVEGEDIHEAINTGSEPWRNVIVEMK